MHRLEPLRSLCLGLGLAAAAGAVVSPLDSLGRDGLMTAHVTQHIVLGDLAAPLLLLGLPRPARQWLGRRLDALAGAGGAGRAAARAVSPLGALALWSVATYVWFLPPVHRAAIGGGTVHLLDHLSFLAFGLLVWLAAFDPRATRAPLEAVWRGGMPWWGRHVYAMTTRLAMLVPAAAVWLAAAGSYHRGSAPLPFGYSVAGDQSRAAQLLIGFEMLLFALALVLAFVFLSIADGRERAAAATRAVCSGEGDEREDG